MGNYQKVLSNDTLSHLSLSNSPETLCGRPVVALANPDAHPNTDIFVNPLTCDLCQELSAGDSFVNQANIEIEAGRICPNCDDQGKDSSGLDCLACGGSGWLDEGDDDYDSTDLGFDVDNLHGVKIAFLDEGLRPHEGSIFYAEADLLSMPNRDTAGQKAPCPSCGSQTWRRLPATDSRPEKIACDDCGHYGPLKTGKVASEKGDYCENCHNSMVGDTVHACNNCDVSLCSNCAGTTCPYCGDENATYYDWMTGDHLSKIARESRNCINGNHSDCSGAPKEKRAGVERRWEPHDPHAEAEDDEPSGGWAHHMDVMHGHGAAGSYGTEDLIELHKEDHDQKRNTFYDEYLGSKRKTAAWDTLDFTCEKCGGKANNAHIRVPGYEGKKLCGQCRVDITGEAESEVDGPGRHSFPRSSRNWTRDGYPIDGGFNVIITKEEAARIPFLDRRVTVSEKINCPDCSEDKWLQSVASCMNCDQLKCTNCFETLGNTFGTCKKCANTDLDYEIADEGVIPDQERYLENVLRSDDEDIDPLWLPDYLEE